MFFQIKLSTKFIILSGAILLTGLYFKIASGISHPSFLLLCLLWLFFFILCIGAFKVVFITLTEKIYVNDDGIFIHYFPSMREEYFWSDYLRKEVVKSKNKIKSLKIFFKNSGKPLILLSDIEDFESLIKLVTSKIHEK